MGMDSEAPVIGTGRGRAEEVYRRDGHRLWRSMLGFAGDREIADDAVAEAFAQLLLRGDEIKSPAAWVWKAAYRIAAGELQRRHRFEPLAIDQVHRDPETEWEVIDALKALSPQQRAIVMLRDYAGHSTRQTAAIVESTEASVRVQLSRARRALRRELTQ
jgi:RNA polymerase sigma-70 factor (ECF subfamily)